MGFYKFTQSHLLAITEIPNSTCRHTFDCSHAKVNRPSGYMLPRERQMVLFWWPHQYEKGSFSISPWMVGIHVRLSVIDWSVSCDIDRSGEQPASTSIGNIQIKKWTCKNISITSEALKDTGYLFSTTNMDMRARVFTTRYSQCSSRSRHACIHFVAVIQGEIREKSSMKSKSARWMFIRRKSGQCSLLQRNLRTTMKSTCPRRI